MSAPVYCLDDFGKKANEVSFYIERLSVHLAKHEFVSRPHKHDFYMILYISSGKGDHRIDFINYKVTAGSFYLMTPGQVHAWKLDRKTDGYIIFFTPTFYHLQWNDSRLLEFPFFHALSPNPLIKVKRLAFESIIPEMYAEFSAIEKNGSRVLRTYLDLLLLKLSRNYKDNQQTSFTSDSFKIRKLEELINKNFLIYRQPVDYADLMNLSAPYLNTICKINVNKTLSQLIQERVNLEAKRLLAYSDLTVNEIAAQLNFSTTSHFIKYFKNSTDFTPDEFKESMIRTI